MQADIRNRKHISHKDIIELNFIRKQNKYVFRKYYKQGLRSHIMEVLHAGDVLKQNKGDTINGLIHYPIAKPFKILRIFRTKFNSLSEIMKEIGKYKIIEKYLPADCYAKSYEFIVEYVIEEKHDYILCGLQDYVEGKVFNPWDLDRKNHLANLIKNIQSQGYNPLKMTTEHLIQRVQKQVNKFIKGLKKMIMEANYVPDLAGIGNFILTYDGKIKLVDINNISKVSFGSDISIDDKGYPVCDKSIEAISIIEQKLLNRSIDKNEKIYRTFLDPQRLQKVKDLDANFHHSL